MFRQISRNAGKKGLVLNSSKTNLFVISASKSYEARAHFYDGQGTRIDSTSELKALGFIFNQRGDISSSQVEKLCAKFRQKAWSLRHLRRSGFTKAELVRMYTSYIRPSIEYSLPIYHSMLSGEQERTLEKQQNFALRNMFGFQHSNRQLLEMSGLPTLKERREKATLKFAQKTFNNPCFSHWFPRRRTRQ